MNLHTLPGQIGSTWLLYSDSDHDSIETEFIDQPGENPSWVVVVRCTNRYKLPGAIVQALALLEEKEAEGKLQAVKAIP